MSSSYYLTNPVRVASHRWGENTKPLVSIFCITYNHALFIKDAIDGFLNQRTTFPVEILIHDDASTDKTAEIIREYEKKFPKLIRPFYQKVNQFSQGVDPFKEILIPCALGKYIALCEGDDYWTDPLKLQKQMDIFYKHPDTVLCGARALTWSEKRKEFTQVTPSLDKEIVCMTPRQFFYLGDWVKNCTRVVPKELFASVPVEYFRDYKLVHYLLAKNPSGFFRCLDEVVAVYREHAGGIFSGAKPVDVLIYNFESKILLARLFSDDRLHSMKERAADAAIQLAQIRNLDARKRVYYAWQYIVLLYGDISIPGIKRTILRILNILSLRLSEHSKIKRFFKPLALFVRRKFLDK
jgi:glycosyltransferase involved in cell wall biosynthesis